MSIQNDLKRIVDNGELHTAIGLNLMEDITLFPKISKVFVLDLKEFENPLNIRIKYHTHEAKEKNQDVMANG